MIQNYFYHFVGLVILALNKIRHTVTGYRRPRPFSVTEIDKAVEYDLELVQRIEQELKRYTGSSQPFKNKVILELGPGADLGVGMTLLHKRAKKYLALDINRLAPYAPREIYSSIAKKIDANRALIVEVDKAIAGKSERLVYKVDKRFDPRVLKNERPNLIVSNAAFEHFDDIEKTIKRLSKTVARGAVFIADIDLQTHTRWIRENDPLNIYRYSWPIYTVFKFKGSPNRVRPQEYVEIMQKYGWKDIEVIPRITTEGKEAEKVRKYLSKHFRKDPLLHVLDFYLVAKKG